MWIIVLYRLFNVVQRTLHVEVTFAVQRRIGVFIDSRLPLRRFAVLDVIVQDGCDESNYQ